MKNKRWKRKAKRLIGHCMSVKCCNCEYFGIAGCDEFGEPNYCCNALVSLPFEFTLRNLEEQCKPEKYRKKMKRKKIF